MAKRKKFSVITIVESALLLAFVAAAVFVAANLRPATFTASDGTAVVGWRWGSKVYVDAAALTTGMDAALDVETLSIAYTERVDPEQIRAETTETMTLQFDKDADAARQAHESAMAELEAQIAEQARTIEELQARIDELEGKPSASPSGAGRGSSSSGTGGNSQAGSSGASGAGGTGGGGGTTPTPAPTPAPPPAPAVDAAACIAAARSHALALGMTEDGSLGIGNSGYLNPPDISVLTQDNVIASLIYCLNQYASYAPDDHSLVHFNIVQSGNLIYALYQ